MIDRRKFLRIVGSAGGVMAAGGVGLLSSACRGSLTDEGGGAGAGVRHPLRIPREVGVSDLTLAPAPGRVETGGGSTAAWLFNGQSPGPTIRARRGERARILLRNDLGEKTIVHWHGLVVPEAADGHPRLAIGPGATYDYEFTVDQRAGTYWYHPHTHMRTAIQTYMGLAGLFLVVDEEEAALGLPSDRYEIPLVLQDKRLGPDGELLYAPFGPDMMQGYLGDVPFGNGIARPSLDVDRALYRFRVLNGSNARIFDLALSNGAPLILIGNDGGLLEAPEPVGSILLGPAERADFLVDLTGAEAGERVMLQSLPFSLPSMGMGGMIAAPQGTAMDLLELVVTGPVVQNASIPGALSTIPALSNAVVVEERTFVFDSMQMRHTINGIEYEMDRVDVRVPLGQTERWHFVNQSNVPHPVHLHATHFQIQRRTGGRGRLMPAEKGLKDTVLLLPGERVEVLVRFEEHRGLFLLHCHNLEHEDMGMMLNVAVE